jgi:hypothetical protein
VVTKTSCFALPRALTDFGLQQVAERDGHQIWVRGAPSKSKRGARP